MSGYGRVISGGDQMRKGVTKGINDKLDQLEDKRESRSKLAATVRNAFKQKNLSDNNFNDIEVGQPSTKFGGKKGNNFTKPTAPSKV
jgi:hypothetical protein